ncbi:MAG: prepilin-type N-terminal cleavage/methylation domain-containing protein [Phycisphaerales bacterium]
MTRRSRGFTLLEVILASSIGGLVLIGALGVLITLQRSDRLASAKFERVTESERLHKVLARAFSNLLMSSRPTKDPRTADGEAGSGATPPAPPPPPRLLLTGDPQLGGLVLRRGENSQGGPGAGMVQRVELVVSRSPVPVRSKADDLAYAKLRESEDSMFADNGADSESGAMSKLSQSRGGISQAFRGALELRPMLDPGDRSDRPPTYSLWWRPLPSLGDDGTPVGSAPPPPVELMDRLVYFHVQMFDDSQMKDELAATWERDLPGYVQVEIETVEGLWRKWMFEVDWNNGSEARGANGSDEDSPEAQETDTDHGKAAGQAGAAKGAFQTKPGGNSKKSTTKKPAAGGGTGGNP